MSSLIATLNTQNHWEADGVQTVWNFTFSDGYLSRDFVKAYTRSPAGVRTELTINDASFIGEFQLSIVPAVPDGHTLVIYRSTQKTAPLVDFEDGAFISEANLDTIARQGVHLAAESADFFGVTTEADLVELGQAAAASAAASAASAVTAAASQTASAASATTASGFSAAASSSATAAALSASNAAGAATTAVNAHKALLATPTGASNAAGAVAFAPSIADFSPNYTLGTLGWAMRSNALNALWFGVPTDGSDATPLGQAVIDLALSLGRGVYFPGATYTFNGGAASPDGYKNGLLTPFSVINFDPKDGFAIYGDAGQTVFQAGANDMVILRVSRNCVTVRDITLYGNGKTNVVGRLIGPEDMTQVTDCVSNSFSNWYEVNVEGCTEGTIIQPGPRPTTGPNAGSDSGCFYHRFFGGLGNQNTRHVWFKKGATWAVDVNRVTRTSFFGHHLLRGNAGYHMEVGSEVDLHGCTEELINSGTSPLATPTARYVSADCANINFFGGYSEACTKAFAGFASGIVTSYAYIPASGSDLDFKSYVSSFVDQVSDDNTFTPVLASSGGGAQGASTSAGFLTKIGRIVHFSAQISAAKGTLGAGTLSVTGMPFVADAGWTSASFQHIPVPLWSGITMSANVTCLSASITGATLTIRKLHAAGAGPAGLTLAECADPVVFTVQGWYKAT